MSGGPRDLIDDLDKIDGTDYTGDDELDIGDGYEDDDDGGDAPDNGDDDSELVAPPSKQKQVKEPREPGPASGVRRVKNANDPSKDKTEIRRLANGVHVDAQGNIVDPRDGTIIARAGSERRLFEKNMRADGQLGEVRKENETLKAELSKQQYLNTFPQKYNLGTDEVQTALALAAIYKQNPVEAARNMIEMVLAQGHNVTEILGNDAGNALEMGAVRQMIDERLSPITDQHKARQTAETQQKEAERQLRQFVSDHEYSDIHLTVLDRMMGDNPQLSPEKAYYELKLFCQRRGLDFTQPLKPQLEAVRDQVIRQNLPAQPQQRRGLPNGRQSNSSQRDMGDTLQANPDQSWSDIIKSSM